MRPNPEPTRFPQPPRASFSGRPSAWKLSSGRGTHVQGNPREKQNKTRPLRPRKGKQPSSGAQEAANPPRPTMDTSTPRRHARVLLSGQRLGSLLICAAQINYTL